MTIVRWTFEVVDTGETFSFPVNPNEGGSAVPEKSMNVESFTGINTNGILQQGPWDVAQVTFSGVILTREQDELMEKWALRKVMLKMTDDLHRTFIGRLTSLSRNRIRRASRPWYSQYDAEFLAFQQVNASSVKTWG